MRATPALITAALLISACSGSDGQSLEPEATDSTTTIEAVADTEPDESSTTATSTTTAPETTTTDAATTTVAPTTTEPAPEPPAPDTVGEVWAAVWAAAAVPGATVEDLADLATAEVADRLLTTLQREGPERSITNMPTIGEPAEDGTVPINDCLIISPPATATAANWYSGTATTDDNGTTRITSLTPESITGCVPKAVADQVLTDYEKHWTAAAEYWRPADPDNPLVAETLTGGLLELVNGLLVEHQANGWELRRNDERHPEIIEYRSPTEIVILDCQLIGLENGLFVTATGERLPDVPPVAPGTRDARSSVMILEDGNWKNSDRQGSTNVDCEFAPTDLGVPVV